MSREATGRRFRNIHPPTTTWLTDLQDGHPGRVDTRGVVSLVCMYTVYTHHVTGSKDR